MNDESLDKLQVDETTRFIINRLGERQRKLMRIVKMEKKLHSSLHRQIWITTSVAACFFLFFICNIYKNTYSPLEKNGIESPMIMEYRAANPELSEISMLIKKKQYEEALGKTATALEKSDLNIKEFTGIGRIVGDEEMEYDEEMDRVINSEIRWTYIYLLIKLNKNKEAKKQLRKYLKNKDYCEYEEDAKKLLKEIK